MEQRKQNPKKRLAMHLAHQMDDEKRIYDEHLSQWQMDEIREAGKELRNEILRSGFNVDELLFLAEQYKTLTFKQYGGWFYDEV